MGLNFRHFCPYVKPDTLVQKWQQLSVVFFDLLFRQAHPYSPSLDVSSNDAVFCTPQWFDNLDCNWICSFLELVDDRLTAIWPQRRRHSI